MGPNANSRLGRLLHHRTLARWKSAARDAPHAELATLRTLRQQARQLRGPLQELSYIADDRLALPRIGSNAFTRPGGTDWSWRPLVWRARLPKAGLAPAHNKSRLGEDISIFHDCQTTEISLRQTRNLRDHDLAPFGVSLEVFRFDGNFLSILVDLPAAACKGLRKRHLVRLGAVIEHEHPTTIFARLNIKHGPNTEQLLLTLPTGDPDVAVEFDLGYSKINEKRIEHMWVDLMIQEPQMNRITIRDLNFCRFPRAEL